MDSQTVLRNVREPVFAVDSDREIAFVNERFSSVTGRAAESVVGAGYDLVAAHVESGFEELAAAIDGVLRGDVDGERLELTMVHPEDAPVPRRLPADVRVTSVVEDGTVTGALVVLRDEAARTERERSLRESQRRFEAVLESPESFIGVLDTDGTLLTANSTALEFVDADREEVVGEPFPETPWWTHSTELQDRLRDWIDRAASGEYVRFDAEHESSGGETIPVDGIVRPVRDADDEVVSLIVEGRDVSARRAYERELERQNERLERFAGVVSHDLRNPLNVASGRLELARSLCDSEAVDDHLADVDDHLADVEAAHDRMSSLIEDLLTLTREGERASEVEPVDLRSAVENCWETVETGTATLRVETDRTVEADRNRLKQLLENLFRNAVTHAGPDVTVTVGECEDGFYLADDGPGVPAADRDSVFEAGFSTDDRGTGFGLNIVRTVAEAHGWAVQLTESDGGGARFEFLDVD